MKPRKGYVEFPPNNAGFVLDAIDFKAPTGVLFVVIGESTLPVVVPSI